MKLLVSRCEVGILATNCYIVLDMESGKSFVVDPGLYDVSLVQTLRRMEIKQLDYILLTHGHHDHILGVRLLKETFGGKLVMHESEAAFLTDDSLSLRRPLIAEPPRVETADLLVADGDTLKFGNDSIKVLHTPGHTRGSVCYLVDDLMFCGDTVFRETVGRTDLPTGSMPQMLSSVRRIAALPGDYKLFPGHGEETTLEHERHNNPYMM